ncbi:sugar ABC transporter substrate-binding protein [Microbacterium marinilacus]|uniref:Periplasmic binding protein domain-containing protein n=1 Tax=Microbacterium marinilacus TaxID=415209 RepID=A0ABP7BBJ3_9MICO|nr:sugar ABC transporter substrate-binding protein [Microbacterium marinilacus]MBY0687099.1 sugar ABC transporter substrate-binding protein [Microbacterium marinilacus]
MHARTMRKPLAAAGVSLFALAALVGCSVDTGGGTAGESAEKTDGMGDDGVFKVAAFTAGYGTPGGKLTLDDFVAKGNEQENWEVTLYTSSFDYDKINSDIQTAITQGADAILAGFPDPRQTAPLEQAAAAAGIPIFSIDGGVEPNDAFAVDITFSQQQMAEATVGALEEAMGGLEGKNVMVIGHDPHIGITTRSNLALDLLEESGSNIAGGEMKQALDPGTGRTEALNFVTDYLQANPDGLDGVWVGWDDAALGAVKAINEAGRDDIFVTGVDALEETTVEIKKDGPMYASMAQDWIGVVDQMIDIMNDYRDSATLPEDNFIDLDGELIDRSNVDSFEPTL